MGLSLDARWPGAFGASRFRRIARQHRPLRQVVTVILLALLVASGTSVTRSAVETSGLRRKVIIRTLPGHEYAVAREVSGLGGRIEMQLPIIHGFSAVVPEAALEAIARDRAVLAITLNRRMTLMGMRYPAPGSKYSMKNISVAVRARSMWSAGYTGAGVDIALIDSGVSPVEGLNLKGKLINGPDLSFESQAPNLRYLDTYGHGTHMAGIMAGRDGDAVRGKYAADKYNFLGIAPDARIVSIKVADSHGNTDVSQVIAAIGWVVQHGRDRGLNIRVLNLSFGTQNEQSYLLDPLAFAAEVAWHRGIAVVAAAGNSGRDASGLADPAYDPYLIAAGAADHHGYRAYSRWKVADFSQTGDGVRNPDVVAPGAHVESLRVPGSYLDQKHPGARVSGRFFKGSGSSQAAAVVSGALALMFQKHRSMSPNQAKALLKNSANGLRDYGFGRKQGELGLRLDTVVSAKLPAGKQSFAPATGLGTLEGSRGSVHLEKDGVPLEGEQDIFGQAFDSAAMAALEAAAASWSGGTWNGNDWAGNEWQGNNWESVEWSGDSWSGNEWAGNEWAGNEWLGNEWAGNEWAGNEWASGAWSSASWS